MTSDGSGLPRIQQPRHPDYLQRHIREATASPTSWSVFWTRGS